jgi:hypothetical protein
MTLLRSAVIAAAGMALSLQGAAHAGGGRPLPATASGLS